MVQLSVLRTLADKDVRAPIGSIRPSLRVGLLTANQIG
jgi:hypothetical protein